ncbi:MAG: hypothetical protein WC538_24400 [Thermoanaerobaculia bacterium]|jgi:hypothetical protein
MFGIFKKKPTSVIGPAESFRACNVYCHADADKAIVAAVFNHGGLVAEKPGGATTLAFSDLDALEEAVQAALRACEFRLDFDYSESKKSDWPAYQASRYKTMKAFEADFVNLHVRGANASNLIYTITSPSFGEFGLELQACARPSLKEFAEAIHYMVKAFRACEAAVEL